MTDKEIAESLRSEPSWFQKILDWWDGLKIKPHVAVRDLNEGEGRPVSAAEIGIKIKF